MNYPGGKNGHGAYQLIINCIPWHPNFFELFGGSAPVSRYKKPAPGKNIIVEINPAVIDANDYVAGEVICCDAIKWLRENQHSFADSDVIYLDPPYIKESRRSQKDLYKFELTTEQHIELLSILVKLNCCVIISGYPSNLYKKMLKGWRTKTYKGITRGGPSLEMIWMNFPEPDELHQYDFLGKDFIDRQRVKRKLDRIESKLLKLPKFERAAILDRLKQMERNL